MVVRSRARRYFHVSSSGYLASYGFGAKPISSSRWRHYLKRPHPRVIHRSVPLPTTFCDGVAAPDISWELDEGPWFANGVMSIEFHGAEARAIIEHAHVRDGDRQELERTLELELSPAG